MKWKDDKGFGYIAPDGGGPEIFLHEDSFLRHSRRPMTGEVVTFEVIATFEGKAQAKRVLFLGESDPRKIAMIGDLLLVSLALGFFAISCGLVYLGALPLSILISYLSASFLSLIVYRFDKLAAGSNQWRTKESLLHLLSVLGGWPGALIAQRIFRHKSRKRSFQRIYWGTVVINVGLLVLLMLPVSKVFLTTSLPAYSIKYKKNIADRLTNHKDKEKTESALNLTGSSKHKGAIYSWTNKEGKKVFSSIGFPDDQAYTDGKIEWR